MSLKYSNIVKNLSAIALPLMIVILFFPHIFRHPGNYFFASGGDGLKSYFGTYYTIKYDKDYFHSVSQNYPYGESVFYTDSQPVISSVFALLKKIGIDLSDYLIAFLNFFMLVSIPVGAFFLYLLFRRLKLPYWYSIIISSIIAFLSPQLDRLGGHFSLSYVFMLPLFLLTYYNFFKFHNLKNSIYVGLVVFLGLGMHAYYFAFFAIILIFGIFVLLFDRNSGLKIITEFITYLFLQLLLPFTIFTLISGGGPDDRSAYPWGFFSTRAYFESVFLPNGKPYANFINIHYLNWEGIAFIGMVASIGFMILIGTYFRKRFKNNPLQLHTDSFINMLLWVSILALFFSFTFPFSWGLEWLWNYLGPIKQFRASGRFAWIFYYVINIAVFYSLWKWFETKNRIHYTLVFSFVLLWGTYDAFLNVRGKENLLRNEISEISDQKNLLPQDKWIKQLDTKKYQAIISLPYYHVGSETYWIEGSGNSAKFAYITSWKTGLPICNVMLSRTSISQTTKNLAIKWEPLSNYNIIGKFRKDKDILLLEMKGEVRDDNELRLIKYAEKINENENFNVYVLNPDAFMKISNDYKTQLNSEIDKFERKTSLFADDTNRSFHFLSYGRGIDNRNVTSAKTINAKKSEVLLDTILFNDTIPVKISFWMKDLNKDLIPRSRLVFNYVNKDGNLEEVNNVDIFKIVKYVDSEGWGLVETEYKPKSPSEKFRIYMSNDLAIEAMITIDNLMIRPIDLNVYSTGENYLMKNNRLIFNEQ
jgi:hypothetical protein